MFIICYSSISIQALYDYKIVGQTTFPSENEFQFKHCTIIRAFIANMFAGIASFQFKHCTIIRTKFWESTNPKTNFNSSIVRL